MLAHYSHVRLDAKRKALEALVSEGTEGCHDTNNVTNQKAAVVARSEVIEINGRLVGTRTPDLYRVNLGAA